MKLINKILIILIILFSISACSGLKESLSLKKKQGVDEFLIEKKNPLTVPPDYSSLPKPKNKIETIEEDTSIDLKKVLSSSNEKKEVSSSNNLEKSISNILNKK